MSQITRQEVLVLKRTRYARAGKEHKTKIINGLAELFGCHRKAAIRAIEHLRLSNPTTKDLCFVVGLHPPNGRVESCGADHFCLMSADFGRWRKIDDGFRKDIEHFFASKN